MGFGSIKKAIKRGIKNYTSKDFLTSPSRWYAAATTYGLSEFTNVGNWYSKQAYSKYIDVALAAAIAANAISTATAGTAASGTSGAGASGAGEGAGAVSAGASTAAETAAAETAAEGGGISSGSKLALGALGLSTGAQIYQSRQAASAQSKAQAAAQARADAAARESEIMRKQALLSSQKSMAARRAAAGAIVNKLRNTNVQLGSDEEKLGD